jgi:glycine/D-amino acid oxidase-like deaminating enzyme
MPIEGIVSTSLIYENSIPPSEVGTALFFEEDSNGCHLEVFGRHDQSMYVSGCGESQVIGTRALRSKDCPAPGHCSPNTARATAAQKSLKRTGFFSGKHIDMKPNSIQACMRPTSPDGVPIVGRILDNVYVATGGGPWGITWGPLMGKCLASLINEDDDLPIRLAPLSHQRFDTLIYKSLLKSRAPDDT